MPLREEIFHIKLFSFYLSDNWPTEAKVIDVTFGMKCGLDVLKGKGRVPKRILKKLARRGANKAANRRGPESFGVCPEARGTFAANVSCLFIIYLYTHFYTEKLNIFTNH